MDAYTISRMVPELPSTTRTRSRVSRRASEIRAYAKFYSKLDFGHYFADQMLESGKLIPVWLPSEDYHCLQSFYEFENGHSCDWMMAVLSLREPEMKTQKAIIEAMLLDRNATIEQISQRTGWDPEVIQGYEKLFFNVRDRLGDHLFIAKVAYPDTRIVETYSEYLESEDVDSLLMRVGHVNGIDDVAHMAGIKTALMSDLAEESAAQKLENTIMANGFILARNGWLHNRNSEAVRSARMLIAAAKQGRGEDNDTDPFTSASDALMGELKKAKREEALEALPHQRKLQQRQTEVVT